MPWFTKKKKEGKFRLFRPYSRPISAVSGLFQPPADTARFWPNQPGLAWIEADSARIEPSRRETAKKKKKNTADADQRPGNRVVRRVPRHATLDAGAAPLVPRPCFLVCKAVQVSHMQCLQLFLKCLELAFSFSSLGSSTQPNSAVTLIFTLGNSRIHPLSLGVWYLC